MAGGRVAATLRTVRILWSSLLVAHFAFLLMIATHLAKNRGEPMPPHLPELLGALSLGLAIFSIVFPARTFDAGLRSLEVRTTTQVGEAVGSFRESAPVEKVVADPEQTVMDAFRRFQQPFMMGLALAESISLFGFLVGYFGAPPSTYAPFFAAGIGLTLAKFPRLSMITGAVERVKGARCDLRP